MHTGLCYNIYSPRVQKDIALFILITTAPCCTLLGVVLLTVASLEALDHQAVARQLDDDLPLLADQARDLEHVQLLDTSIG